MSTNHTCESCRWCSVSGEGFLEKKICHAAQSVDADMITGEGFDVSLMRTDGYCGKNGEWWEMKGNLRAYNRGER